MRQVFADVETTGLDAASGDRIIEIALIEVIDRVPTGKVLHHYLNPERDIDAAAQAVHGITRESLEGKPKFREIVGEVVEFLKDADEFVAHNAPFDSSFIDEELSRMRKGKILDYATEIRDSLKLAKELYPGKRNSLDALCERLEVDSSAREFHGALLDTQLLVEVFLKMSEGLDLTYDPDAPRVLGTINRLPADRAPLPVRKANESELSAHQNYLAAMEKETKKAPLFGSASVQEKPVQTSPAQLEVSAPVVSASPVEPPAAVSQKPAESNQSKFRF